MRMRSTIIIGVILIVIGIVALVYQGITYTTHKKIIDVGPIQATAETKKTIPLPPVVGVLAFAGGIVLVIVGTRRS
jgi:dipeptide/tripeptide permease